MVDWWGWLENISGMILGLKIWWIWDCYFFYVGMRGNVKNLLFVYNVDLDMDVVGSCLCDLEFGCECGGFFE